MMNVLLIVYVALVGLVVLVMNRWERAMKVPGMGPRVSEASISLSPGRGLGRGPTRAADSPCSCPTVFPRAKASALTRTHGRALRGAGARLPRRGGAVGAGQPGILATMWKWTPLLAQGFALNIAISFLAMAIGTGAGFLLGIAQISLVAPVREASWFATQFFRNSPWLVLLFYCMLLLPFELVVGGTVIPLPGWMKATVGLALPVMANVSEIVRGAIQSIPYGQWESAESLAFTRRQTLWMIILPQCIRRMTPPWMNLYAILTVATPLTSIVGVNEAMTLTQDALAAEAVGRSCWCRSTSISCSGFSSTATRSRARPRRSRRGPPCR